jgi:hypothetical protein
MAAAGAESTAALLRASASVRQDRATPPKSSILHPSRGLRSLAPDGAGIPVCRRAGRRRRARNTSRLCRAIWRRWRGGG